MKKVLGIGEDKFKHVNEELECIVSDSEQVFKDIRFSISTNIENTLENKASMKGNGEVDVSRNPSLKAGVSGQKEKSIKQKWLDKQPERYKNLDLDIIEIEKNNTTRNWLKSGLYFGVFMFLCMVIIYPLIRGKEITLEDIMIGIPLWIIGGLVWGLTMKWWMNKKGKEKKALNS